MKQVSETNDDLVLGIPLVLRPRIVRVQLEAIRVRLEIEDVRIAIGIDRIMRTPIYITVP